MKHVVCTITQTKAILIRREFVWKNEFYFSYDGFSKTLTAMRLLAWLCSEKGVSSVNFSSSGKTPIEITEFIQLL